MSYVAKMASFRRRIGRAKFRKMQGMETEVSEELAASAEATPSGWPRTGKLGSKTAEKVESEKKWSHHFAAGVRKSGVRVDFPLRLTVRNAVTAEGLERTRARA